MPNVAWPKGGEAPLFFHFVMHAFMISEKTKNIFNLTAWVLLFFMPALYFLAAKNTAIAVFPRNSLAEAGRKVYENSGCVFCHSRVIRKSVPELVRYLPDEYYKLNLSPEIFFRIFSNDYADFTGRAIAPDLGYLPYSMKDELYIENYIKNPRAGNVASIMPAYSRLYREKLRADEIYSGWGSSFLHNGYDNNNENYSRGKALNSFLLTPRADFIRR